MKSNLVGNKYDKDFLIEVAKGTIPGHSYEHKFGRNSNVSTSLVTVSVGGIYQTPTGTVSLEFVSSSASDALDDIGAHEITFVGLDANWDEQIVPISAHATDGTIAVAITGTWRRLYRAYVSKSGSYATTSTASHVGTITIRVSGGGATYATIPLEGTFGLGQTFIGAYTVPAGFTAYILSGYHSSDISGTKTCDYFFFQRTDAGDTTSSYDGTLRVQQLSIGTQGEKQQLHISADSYPEKTDIGFLSKASATSDVSVEFELLIVDNNYL